MYGDVKLCISVHPIGSLIYLFKFFKQEVNNFTLNADVYVTSLLIYCECSQSQVQLYIKILF